MGITASCRHANARRTTFAVASFASHTNAGLNHEDVSEIAKLTWKALRDVKYEVRYNKDYQMDISYPVFGSSVRQLQGKELYITGYIIPLNPGEGLYAVSRNNFASCFFCGRAGPESIISLKFKNPPRRYKTDEYLTIEKGKWN